jgi:hypothetical protein
MPEKERVDFSLPDSMDPDTLIPIPLHCISDIFAWMAYTRVIHPQSAFAKDIETIRQAVWDVNKNGNKVDKTSMDDTIEEGYALIATLEHFSFPVLSGREIYKYPVEKGDILVIEKIEGDKESGDPEVAVLLIRYNKRIGVKKSYLTELVMNKRFMVSGPPDAVRMLTASL